jgi:hypothetical protein
MALHVFMAVTWIKKMNLYLENNFNLILKLKCDPRGACFSFQNYFILNMLFCTYRLVSTSFMSLIIQKFFQPYSVIITVRCTYILISFCDMIFITHPSSPLSLFTVCHSFCHTFLHFVALIYCAIRQVVPVNIY